jgi:hypothetical protein
MNISFQSKAQLIENELNINYKNIIYETWHRDGELELRMCNNDRSMMFDKNPLLPVNTVYIHIIGQLERAFKIWLIKNKTQEGE